MWIGKWKVKTLKWDRWLNEQSYEGFICCLNDICHAEVWWIEVFSKIKFFFFVCVCELACVQQELLQWIYSYCQVTVFMWWTVFCLLDPVNNASGKVPFQHVSVFMINVETAVNQTVFIMYLTLCLKEESIVIVDQWQGAVMQSVYDRWVRCTFMPKSVYTAAFCGSTWTFWLRVCKY